MFLCVMVMYFDILFSVNFFFVVFMCVSLNSYVYIRFVGATYRVSACVRFFDFVLFFIIMFFGVSFIFVYISDMFVVYRICV